MRCPDEERFAQFAEAKFDNGDERAEFLEHLSECPECSALYAMAYGNLSSLAGACPDEEGLAALAEGKLSQQQREDLLKHIAVCDTCSTELYYLRKSKFADATVKAKTKKISPQRRHVFQLVAIAAMIALMIGFTGISTLNNYSYTSGKGQESVEPRDETPPANLLTVSAPASPPEMDQDIAVEAEEAPKLEAVQKPEMGQDAAYEAHAPEFRVREENKTQDTTAEAQGGKNRNIGFEQKTDESPAALRKQQLLREYPLNAGISAVAKPVFEVIYTGHDGDESEIVKLIRLVTGKDEEGAKITAKSPPVVIKECSSMKEAQEIKKELESAGAKIEIKRR
ncbi:MAG: ribosomal protein L7/L12 [Synergistaceae bacterium]|nr:ribosomal protein L7/L12 [Synergistaceae bacterium]